MGAVPEIDRDQPPAADPAAVRRTTRRRPPGVPGAQTAGLELDKGEIIELATFRRRPRPGDPAARPASGLTRDRRRICRRCLEKPRNPGFSRNRRTRIPAPPTSRLPAEPLDRNDRLRPPRRSSRHFAGRASADWRRAGLRLSVSAEGSWSRSADVAAPEGSVDHNHPCAARAGRAWSLAQRARWRMRRTFPVRDKTPRSGRVAPYVEDERSHRWSAARADVKWGSYER